MTERSSVRASVRLAIAIATAFATIATVAACTEIVELGPDFTFPDATQLDAPDTTDATPTTDGGSFLDAPEVFDAGGFD